MIIKLNRRKKKYKKIIFIVLGVLVFLCCSFLSGFLILEIFKITKNIFVLLIGNLGTAILFGSVGGILTIKIFLIEIRKFKDNNCIDELYNKCDKEREKLFVVKSSSLSNVESASKNNVCNNLNTTNLRIVNNGCENVVVKKRVRKREDFFGYR